MKTIFNLLKSVALCVVILVMSVTTSAQSSCYLIGGISDDIEPTIENAEALKKFELPIGESKVFNIPAGKFDFYLCGDLSNPSATAFGAYENDGELLIDGYGEALASVYAGSTTHWTIKDWEGGNVIMYYDGREDLQIRSFPHSGTLNIFGSLNGWNIYASDYELTETSPGSLIYSGKYVISETNYVCFGFVSSQGWSSEVSMIGFNTEDLPLYYNRYGIAESAISFGRNSASIMGYGSEVEFVVDLNSMTAKVIGGDRYAQSSLFVAGVIEEEPTIENEEHYKKWRLFETALGEYSGTINIPAGKFNICLFPELTADGWAAEALCAGVSDVELEPNSMGMASCDMALMTGKAGHWIISDWEGGEVEIKANKNNNTIEFNIPSLNKVFYLVGTMTGWASPDRANLEIYQQWTLPETYEGSNVYEGVFDMPEESICIFRFYKHLTGWDGGDSYGVQVQDSPIDISLTNGAFYGNIMKGKGSWSLSYFPGGTMRITIDMNTQSVSFDTNILEVEDAVKPVLTIAYPEGGVIKQKVDNGKALELQIVPADGWKCHSVTFNGSDVTTQLDATGNYTTPSITADSQLSIVFIKDEVGVANALVDNNIKVKVSGNIVTIIGADEFSNVEIYNTAGTTIYNGIEKSITLDENSVYILTIEGRTFKFAM